MQDRQAPFAHPIFFYNCILVDCSENKDVYNTIRSIKNYACMPLPMYCKFFIILAATVVVFAANAMIDVTTAFAQDQTNNLTALLTANNNNTIANTTMTNNTSAPDMTLAEARGQYLAVWNQTEFNATFNTFIEPFSAAGYGVYEERNSNVFSPGETIVLYVEPVGFGHMQIQDEEGNNTLYLINMTADYEIASPSGAELQMIEDVPVGSIISHRPNTEMFLTLTLTQDVQSLPPGNYVIKYSVNDEVSGESFQLEKEITIAQNVTASSNLA
jgi:hypothetical protein